MVGDDGRHPDAAPRLDRLAERRAVEIVIDDIGNILLTDGLDRQSQLVADGLCRIPGIGGNDFFGMSERRFKLLFGEVAPMRLGERKAIIFHVVTVGALDLLDLMTAGRRKGDHIDPEDILHPAAHDRTAVLFCEGIELIGERCRRGPGIDSLFARRDDVDAADDTLLNAVIDIRDKAEQRDDRDVGIALVEHLIGIVRDDDARLDAELRKVAHIHPDHIGIDIDRTDDLCALLVQVAQDVLTHLAAAVLNHSDPFHKTPLIMICRKARTFPLSPAP